MFGKILNRVFQILVYSIPLFIILGIFDYRFHNYFWENVNFFRIIPGIRMFDFFSVLDIYLLILFVIFLILLIIKEIRIEKGSRWINIPIILIIVGGIIEVFTYTQIEPSIKSLWFQAYLNYANPILLFFVLIFGIKNQKLFKGLKRSFLITFTIFGGVILFKFFTDLLPGANRDFLGRLVWPYIDPFVDMKAESANWLSYLFAPMMLFAIVRLIEKAKEKNRVRSYTLEFLMIVISGLILVLTKSYTGLGIVFFIIAYLIFVYLPKDKRKIFWLGIVIFLIVGIASQYNTQKFQILLGNYKKANSIERRLQIYEFNFNAFFEHPIKGIGLGNYQSYFRENQQKYLNEVIPEEEIPPHPHNLIVGFWSDLGAFGFLAIIFIYIFVIWNIFKDFSNPNRNLYLLVFAYFLGHGLMDLPYGLEENSVLFWIILSFIFIGQRFSKNRFPLSPFRV